MFTVYRLELVDNWADIMRVNMFGCDKYPRAYPVLTDNLNQCKNPHAGGWIAAFYFVFMIIFGEFWEGKE